MTANYEPEFMSMNTWLVELGRSVIANTLAIEAERDSDEE